MGTSKGKVSLIGLYRCRWGFSSLSAVIGGWKSVHPADIRWHAPEG